MISIAASVQGRSTADRLSDSTAPVRRVPTINPKRRRSSAQDDRREPPHLNENRRINGPDRRSDVPSSPPPTQNAARERESLFAKIFKSLLQQNRPQADSCTAANRARFDGATTHWAASDERKNRLRFSASYLHSNSFGCRTVAGCLGMTRGYGRQVLRGGGVNRASLKSCCGVASGQMGAAHRRCEAAAQSRLLVSWQSALVQSRAEV